jgi:DNA polymerase
VSKLSRKQAGSGPRIPLAKRAAEIPAGALGSLRRKAADCRACPLWEHATQTVFGEGPASAAVMLIGEQPGSREDLEGRPFVGPSGHLLDQALHDAGLDRSALYITNAVKHFKFASRGKTRLHQRANAGEQAACRRWLAAELLRVKPRLLVGLGAMAAQTMFGNAFRISHERGEWRELAPDTRGLATWHPSALLRLRYAQERDARYAELVGDLQRVARALDAG